jgi:hypothetical protein
MDHKEHLLYFFLTGKISLSQYDHKFLSNLQMMIHKDSRITTNQATLFDKLISKYARQLNKHNYDKETLKALSWKSLLVESSIEHTGAKVSINDDKLVLRVPFNKNFISSFRETIHNPFEWERSEKRYVAEFSTHALKILYIVLPKFFPTVIYCDQLIEIIDELKSYESKFWTPTLTRINGHLYVVGVNDVLGDILSDIELTLTPKTFFELSMLGVDIDPMLIGDDPKLKFASEFITEVDLDDFLKVSQWIVELGCNKVVFGRGIATSGNGMIRNEIVAAIEHNRIIHPMSYVDMKKMEVDPIPPMLIQYPRNAKLTIRTEQELISKCVVVRNSRPVDIK